MTALPFRLLHLLFIAVIFGDNLQQSVAQSQIDSVPKLIQALKDKDAKVRAKAAEDLAKLGPRAKEAVPNLLVALNDGDAKVVNNAAHALSEINSAAVAALALILSNKSESESVRLCALWTLDRLGPKGRPAIPTLVRALEDKNPKIRKETAYALGGIRGPEALSALLSSLNTETDDLVRNEIVDAFAGFGPEAAAAVPALIKIMNDEDNVTLGSKAANSLAWIGSPSVPSLILILKNSTLSANKREYATLVLSRMAMNPEITKGASAAVPTLIEALKDKHGLIRHSAAMALAELKKNAKEAIPALTQIIKDGSPYDRVIAAKALTWIDPNNPIPIPVFIEALKDPTNNVRDVAIDTLDHLESSARAALPTLTKALVNKDPMVRLHVCNALGSIGPDAKDATPDLKNLLNDENETVRQIALRALQNIQKIKHK